MILAVANQKGGVGKTTTAVNLAHGVALNGRKVLLVDLDTQGNVADALGLESASDLNRLLLGGEAMKVVATHARENLDVIRSNKQTAMLKMVLSGMDFRELVLARALSDHARAGYDLVVLDCPPSTDILHIAALCAADWLLIPARMEQFAIKGISDLLESLKSAHLIGRSDCKLAGIIPTFFDWTTNESHLQLSHLSNLPSYKPYIWPVIPTDTKCREANRAGRSLWEITPRPAALIGRADGSKHIGGYQQAMARMMVML